ncbi:MAG TPA: autotransporter assembly complex family protein [Candidatus Cybelea sp.]|nr:autotransporter assembly complex family protein [Candidatus Cybelea sp.]
MSPIGPARTPDAMPIRSGTTGRRRRVVVGIPAALLFLLAAAPALALDYTVSMTKVSDSTLGQALQESSTLIELEKKPPDDATGLRRRAQDDLDRLQQALRSTGYYDATISIAIDGQPVTAADVASAFAGEEGDGKKQKAKVAIAIDAGPRYRIRNIAIKGIEGLSPLPTIALKSGAPARSADIIAARRQLLDAVLSCGYPLATVTLEPAVVDHAGHTLDVTFTVTRGPSATLGKVSVYGLDHVSKDFIARRAVFPPGTRFSPQALDALRSDLQSLDVFSSVKVTPGATLDPDGTLPVRVDVTERERHFIGFGASYSTNDGAGATAYWGDRNLFGGGERLRLDATVSGLGESSGTKNFDYTLSGNFRKPDFVERRQDLLSSLALTDQHDPETFDKKAVTATAGIERALTRDLKLALGWEIENATIDDHTNTRKKFLLIGPTAGIAWDTTDDLLNPTRGVRVSLSGEAFPTWLGSSTDVFTTNATAAGYLDLSGNGTLVLATRGNVASAFGSDLEDLPADRRLYAGGGGSVRGYKYRSISPTDSHGDPIGGRSMVTGSVELRYRFGDFGIVPFFDAGTASRKATPSFDRGILYAAGLGFRYYTAIGPIRADIAVPLDKRHQDQIVAFYVSIGQAF